MGPEGLVEVAVEMLVLLHEVRLGDPQICSSQMPTMIGSPQVLQLHRKMENPEIEKPQ
jgi:hypothetical protein